jgi:hypothetical protein
MKTVFEDGKLKVEVTYGEVWKNCRKHNRFVEEAKEAFA